MKQLNLTFLAILITLGMAFPAIAQKADTTVIEKEGKKLKVIVLDDESGENQTIKIDKKDLQVDQEEDKKDPKVDVWKTRWAMLDIGKSTYLYNGDKTLINTQDGEINPLKQKIWGSWNVNLHIVKTRMSIYKNYVNIMTGLSFEYYQYRFENNVRPMERQRQQQLEFTPSSINYDKNRLRTWYMTIPLLLNFETNPQDKGKSFRITAGGYAGLRIAANLRQQWDIYDNQIHFPFYLNQFRYGLSGSIGFGPINLYANYALNSMFETGDENRYDVAPLNVGIQVVPF